MTWRVVSAAEIGTSHERTGTPCQDNCWAQVDKLGQDELLSVFVADGAGSAVRGGEGAEIAIEAAVAHLSKKLTQGEFGLSDLLATDIVIAVREHIHSAAEAEGLRARDYACTFLGLISTTSCTLVMQIGDGAVVVDCGSGLEVAVVPMAGEYANMTHFVTDEEAVSILVTKTYSERALKVAAFTDGIQRIALNLATNTPHEPFFAPFFDGLARATAEQEELLQASLARFLGSAPVNERTDDDKTLVLALFKP